MINPQRSAPQQGKTIKGFFRRNASGVLKPKWPAETYATEAHARQAAYVYVKKGVVLLAADFGKGAKEVAMPLLEGLGMEVQAL